MNRSLGWLLVAAFAGIALTAITGFQVAGKSNRSVGIDNPSEPTHPRARHPIVVHHPPGAPRIATGKFDALGREITLSCASCHANRPSSLETKRGEELKEFHQFLQFDHGFLKCVSCHHPVDYNALRLADGRTLAFSDVQSLCSQCHPPQARDYEHGAHGGMNGYWDLTRGPRQRKGCIDCHDPHAPEFPKMVPTFKSRDRFLAPLHHGESHE
jgi:hypothetical protein